MASPAASPQIFRALLLVVLLLSALACAAPGEGKKAEQGYALCQPLIDGLAAYHEEHGTYPDSLDALAPDWVDHVPESYDGKPILYERTEEGYRLEFSYERPGMNHCTYTPVGGWECEGYF